MDRRRATTRVNEDGTPATPPPGSGGAGSLFLVMSAVVLAVIAVAMVMGGGDDDKKKTDNAKGPTVQYRSEKKPRVWPDVEPWTGEINRMHGTIRKGMSEREVIRQFKPPEVKNITHNEYDGIRTLEFADYAGQGGIMNTGGGVKLIVKIDIATGKVLWFQPPMRSAPRN
jgi:hypothetical protein